MDKPANIPPVSLTDITNLVRTEINAALSRISKDAAKRDAAAAERDAALQAKMSALREDMAKNETEAAKRETRLIEESGHREARQMRWFASVVAVAAVALGLWIELRDKPANPPVTVNNPPPVIYAAPPPAPANPPSGE